LKPEEVSLYVVTDPQLIGERRLEDVCQEALEAGVRVFQLRDKGASTRPMIEQAVGLKRLAERYGATFLVNDRTDVAVASGAHGVHVGQDDMPLDEARQILGKHAVIGVSVQTPGEARAAERGGADYLAANLVFETPTKTDLEGNIGLDGVRRLRAASELPLVAIGGIKADNAASVVTAGADGVAVVSAVMAARDVKKACRELLDAVEEGRRMRRG
jgi:thiamine-phosphate pyrophosphorylase